MKAILLFIAVVPLLTMATEKRDDKEVREIELLKSVIVEEISLPTIEKGRHLSERNKSMRGFGKGNGGLGRLCLYSNSYSLQFFDFFISYNNSRFDMNDAYFDHLTNFKVYRELSKSLGNNFYTVRKVLRDIFFNQSHKVRLISSNIKSGVNPEVEYREENEKCEIIQIAYNTTHLNKNFMNMYSFHSPEETRPNERQVYIEKFAFEALSPAEKVGLIIHEYLPYYLESYTQQGIRDFVAFIFSHDINRLLHLSNRESLEFLSEHMGITFKKDLVLLHP